MTEVKLTWTLKRKSKQHIKKWLKILTHHWKIWSRNRNVDEEFQSQLKNSDIIDVRLRGAVTLKRTRTTGTTGTDPVGWGGSPCRNDEYNWHSRVRSGKRLGLGLRLGLVLDLSATKFRCSRQTETCRTAASRKMWSTTEPAKISWRHWRGIFLDVEWLY